MGGNPPEARTNAHSVGSSKRYVPLWFCKRTSRASADQGTPDGVDDACHEPVAIDQTLAAQGTACQFFGSVVQVPIVLVIRFRYNQVDKGVCACEDP